jgi:hypothetical protein
MLQIEPAQLPSQAPPPAQLSAYRLVAPSGVGPSATTELPPPMFRPPQVRFLMMALLPFRMLPQVSPGVAKVNSRNAPPTDAVVEVVELVAVVVELVLVVGLVVVGLVVVVPKMVVLVVVPMVVLVEKVVLVLVVVPKMVVLVELVVVVPKMVVLVVVPMVVLVEKVVLVLVVVPKMVVLVTQGFGMQPVKRK